MSFIKTIKTGVVENEIHGITGTSRGNDKHNILLTDSQNSEHTFNLPADWDFPYQEGQILSVCWVIRKGENNGPYFMVHNHETQDYYFNYEVIKGMYSPLPTTTGCLGVLVLIILLITYYYMHNIQLIYFMIGIAAIFIWSTIKNHKAQSKFLFDFKAECMSGLYSK